MAGKYKVNYVMELLFDEFGLFDSEISEEKSNDAY